MRSRKMGTVFKKEQEVYDQIFRKDKKGLVSFVSYGKYENYVFVEFEDSDPAIYTFDGKLMCVNSDSVTINSFPTLSTAPYDVDFKGFEQKAPPSSVEDANKWVRDRGQFFDAEINYAKERYLSKELYIAFQALKCLIVLREYYNDGWQPDWNDNHTKYCIELEGLDVCALNHSCNARVMSFKTPEIRDKFLEEQRELLEMAKSLL